MAGSEQRIDKWLFFARVVKSRSLAQKLAISGAVRVNREKVSHSARIVRPGDVLTINVHERIRVLRVLDPGVRRGPASEAAALFEDLTPSTEPPEGSDAAGPATPGIASIEANGRPTRRERRDAGRLVAMAWDD
ncbi:RNA-binding S4 domain-containing protein [Aureimonas pseudogalii]|uniref:Ribosome-associated heat shock protein Hsp15 n=1 Tax=Aureimonas pseudogalii TaxID=1744844 RepID=A0A7W6E9M4_9HYPH|nr:RNA-binding S4 domain-containing protein [Aureimonas pseudogalii]MBB3997311.1 ribosome-associated heat shock protein Hsp15 [Aureimonas pseudogalii]